MCQLQGWHCHPFAEINRCCGALSLAVVTVSHLLFLLVSFAIFVGGSFFGESLSWLPFGGGLVLGHLAEGRMTDCKCRGCDLLTTRWRGHLVGQPLP